MRSLNLVTRTGVHTSATLRRDAPGRRFRAFSSVTRAFDERRMAIESTLAAAPVDHDVPDGAVPILDQGALGSCVLNAACAAMQVQLELEGLPAPALSRLFAYWLCSKAQGTLGEDTGTEVALAVDRIGSIGVCEESLWPYTDDASSFYQPPSQALDAVLEGSDNRATGWFKIDESSSGAKLAQLEAALRANHMVEAGSPVSSAIQSYQPGQVLSRPSDADVIGGHAFLVCGVRWSSGRRLWKCRNSWGADWGGVPDLGTGVMRGGYFLVDDSWAADPEFSDLWVLSRMDPALF